ncbi:CLUMA_CG007253, isoform A [Clunio marinus]|uniref:CLUMA_CG007253, isoform A n=1 Tax=Clunio marinus TaxID=568069 RepID=A0A1J1I0C7_9DIPT|nr:CLUMA_CG007253, isoform A [Clunio marinus]
MSTTILLNINLLAAKHFKTHKKQIAQEISKKHVKIEQESLKRFETETANVGKADLKFLLKHKTFYDKLYKLYAVSRVYDYCKTYMLIKLPLCTRIT